MGGRTRLHRDPGSGCHEFGVPERESLSVHHSIDFQEESIGLERRPDPSVVLVACAERLLDLLSITTEDSRKGAHSALFKDMYLLRGESQSRQAQPERLEDHGIDMKRLDDVPVNPRLHRGTDVVLREVLTDTIT